MKQLNHFPRKTQFLKARNACFFSYLLLGLAFFGTIKLSAQSTLTVTNPANTTQKIIVYKNIPGHSADNDYIIKSNQYKIQVRFPGQGESDWKDVFALKTYNKASTSTADKVYYVGDIPPMNPATSNENYLKWTADWSHTYGNIEMPVNTPVEVRITKLDGLSTQLPVTVTTAAAHPKEKVVGETVSYAGNLPQGVAQFTINNPCQITIDFNNAMDGGIKSPTQYSSIDLDQTKTFPAVHTVTLFANPVMVKPAASGAANVTYVDPTIVTTPAQYATLNTSFNNSSNTTLYFMPGVHNPGINFKLKAGRKYYIPGDAIVYGTFNNLTETSVAANGTNIKVFGYGTISGGKQTHPRYIPLTDLTKPNNEDLYKGIVIENASSDNGILNPNIDGITIADPANHATAIDYDKTTFKLNTQKPITFAKWVKIITWRGNGDGIGACQEVSDCFFRTNDDSGYIKGNKYRNIFWKDCNAAVFHMAGIPNKFVTGTSTPAYFPIKINDCEVIYARSREAGGGGSGIFHLRGKGSDAQSINQVYEIDLTVNNFKVSDPRSNMRVFNMFNEYIEDGVTKYGPMYKGMKFNNVTQVAQIVSADYVKQNITIGGSGITTATDVCFKNCKFNNTLLENSAITTLFNKSPNVTFTYNCSTTTARMSGVKSKEVVASSDIKVYSNPDSKILHVDFPNADLSREIQIYNILGQIVYKTTTQNDNVKIDVRSLNLSGVVIVKVIAGDDVSSHKVLVQ